MFARARGTEKIGDLLLTAKQGQRILSQQSLRERQTYTLDRSPVHPRIHTHTLTLPKVQAFQTSEGN